ncbi:uncharacterized protein [Nicotiana sylvestris]|uniref:uncharacterized protein n=1 Tax=Nicotiana sylvestris TaxID=4096 RepID=UPI00388CCBD9
MALFEALYGQRCRSPIGWFEPSEAKLYCTDLVMDALEKENLIQERLLTAQSRQKSYADKKVHDVSSMVGEKVLLKVSPMKGIMRSGKKSKLRQSLSGVHPVFHVSVLRRYHADLSHVLDFSTIQLDDNLGYEEDPVAIVDRQWRSLLSNGQINECKERTTKAREKLEYLEYSLLELEGKVRKRVTDCQNAEGNEGGHLARAYLLLGLRELVKLFDGAKDAESGEGPSWTK